MRRNIDNLHSIQARCAANQPLPPDLQDWLADALGRFLEHDRCSLRAAFGLCQDRGGVPWWREAAIRERDAALRELSQSHFAEQSIYRRAKAIAAIARRYQSTCWPRDRRTEQMPEQYRGTAKEHLWAAFRSGAKMPVSERRLRTLLGE